MPVIIFPASYRRVIYRFLFPGDLLCLRIIISVKLINKKRYYDNAIR